MLRRVLSPLVVALVVAGCGAAELRPSSAAGTTAFRVLNDVGADASLAKVLISVDGVPVPVTILPPRGALGAPLVNVPITPGDHQIAVRASAERKGEVLVVETQQGLRVGATPAAVSIRVFTQGNEVEPLVVALVASGATLLRADELAADPDAGCAVRTPPKLALCRAARALADAEQRRDVVRTSCILEHLGPMREASELADNVRSRDEDIARAADAKVLGLAQKVERCAPHVDDDELVVAPH